jgi:signal transduction histidine kinase
MEFSSNKRLLLTGGFLAAFLVVLVIATMVLYDRAKTHLDNELGERLRAVATTLALAMGDVREPGREGEAIDPHRLATLHLVRSENLLSNVVVLLPDGTTIVDLANFSRPGEINPLIDLDYSAVTLARSGLPAYTSLYRSGDIYLKSAYAPIADANGDVAAIVGVEAGAEFFSELDALSRLILVVDITAILAVIVLAAFFYRQSSSLDKAQAAVIRAENLATMGRMVAGIAHEIRNPLSIIKTSAERLERKFGEDEDAFSYISEEVDQLDRILTGYLNFARAEPSEFSDVPIANVVRRCLLIVEEDIKKKNIHVVNRADNSDIVVPADDKQIQQAVLNILINSCHAVDPAGTITISLEKAGPDAVLRIKDNGCGVAERHMRDITKPFFTTKEQGSGLGLSIVEKIVTEHGGSLSIDSEAGNGTSVTIALPARRRF